MMAAMKNWLLLTNLGKELKNVLVSKKKKFRKLIEKFWQKMCLQSQLWKELSLKQSVWWLYVFINPKYC